MKYLVVRLFSVNKSYNDRSYNQIDNINLALKN